MKAKEKHATHTPGPWHYSEVIRGRDQYYRQIRADFKIAEVHACHSGVAGTKEGRAEDEANARLIAAAPEMYEVLQEILAPCPVKGYLGKYDRRRTYNARKKAREVLAKIEGGEG